MTGPIALRRETAARPAKAVGAPCGGALTTGRGRIGHPRIGHLAIVPLELRARRAW